MGGEAWAAADTGHRAQLGLLHLYRASLFASTDERSARIAPPPPTSARRRRSTAPLRRSHRRRDASLRRHGARGAAPMASAARAPLPHLLPPEARPHWRALDDDGRRDWIDARLFRATLPPEQQAQFDAMTEGEKLDAVVTGRYEGTIDDDELREVWRRLHLDERAAVVAGDLAPSRSCAAPPGARPDYAVGERLTARWRTEASPRRVNGSSSSGCGLSCGDSLRRRAPTRRRCCVNGMARPTTTSATGSIRGLRPLAAHRGTLSVEAFVRAAPTAPREALAARTARCLWRGAAGGRAASVAAARPRRAARMEGTHGSAR